MEILTNEMKVVLRKGDKINVYFEGHHFTLEYDEKTNENLKLTKKF